MVMAAVVAGSGENPLLRTEKGGEWRRLGEEERQLGFNQHLLYKEGKRAGVKHLGRGRRSCGLDMVRTKDDDEQELRLHR
jgi:hypothetical protein